VFNNTRNTIAVKKIFPQKRLGVTLVNP